MRFCVATVSFLLAASSVNAAENPRKPTFHRFVKKALGPAAAAKAVVGAAITQATNTPGEWGQGAAGFGKRVASSFGKNIVKNGIQYSVAAARHEAVGYQRSDQPGFKPRLEHALLATVITQKTTTGRKTLATGEISGAVGSGLISRLWQPASVRTLSAGFSSAGIALAADAGTNVVREFWPEIRHPHRHKPEATNSPRVLDVQPPERSAPSFPNP